jgi:hypothetical protein
MDQEEVIEPQRHRDTGNLFHHEKDEKDEERMAADRRRFSQMKNQAVIEGREGSSELGKRLFSHSGDTSRQP